MPVELDGARLRLERSLGDAAGVDLAADELVDRQRVFCEGLCGVDKTIGVVEKLDELLKKVQKDCE